MSTFEPSSSNGVAVLGRKRMHCFRSSTRSSTNFASITKQNDELNKLTGKVQSATCPCPSGSGICVCQSIFVLLGSLLYLDCVGESLLGTAPQFVPDTTGIAQNDSTGKYWRIDYDANARDIYQFLVSVVNGSYTPSQKYIANLVAGIVTRAYTPYNCLNTLGIQIAVASHGVYCYHHASTAVSMRETMGNAPMCPPAFRLRGRLYHKEQRLRQIYIPTELIMKACEDFEIVVQTTPTDPHAVDFFGNCPHAKNSRPNCTLLKGRRCP